MNEWYAVILISKDYDAKRRVWELPQDSRIGFGHAWCRVGVSVERVACDSLEIVNDITRLVVCVRTSWEVLPHLSRYCLDALESHPKAPRYHVRGSASWLSLAGQAPCSSAKFKDPCVDHAPLEALCQRALFPHQTPVLIPRDCRCGRREIYDSLGAECVRRLFCTAQEVVRGLVLRGIGC